MVGTVGGSPECAVHGGAGGGRLRGAWHRLVGVVWIAPDRALRRRRPFRQALRESPGEWLLERNGLPGKVVGIASTAALILLPWAGLATRGAVIATNYAFGHLPSAVQFGRMLGHSVVGASREIRQTRRERTGGILAAPAGYARALRRGWEWHWWTRPQMDQRHDVAEHAEAPLEQQIDPRDRSVPFLCRKLVWASQWLIVKANGDHAPGERPPGRLTRLAAGWTDDWMNMRARTPGFILGMVALAAGHLAGLGTFANFASTIVLGYVPGAIAFYLAKRTGDPYRFTRTGLMQRPTIIARASRPERAEPVVTLPGVPMDGVAHEVPAATGERPTTTASWLRTVGLPVRGGPAPFRARAAEPAVVGAPEAARRVRMARSGNPPAGEIH